MNRMPKLRFKEFSGEWEEKKLKNIVEINPRTEELPNEFIYIDLESVENGILKEKKIIQKENAPSRAKRNVKLNDILYQTVRPYQQNNLFFYFDDEFEYIASTGYAQLRSIKNNPKYIYQLLHTKKFLDKVLENCTGTSYPAINSNDLGNINILYTLNIKEQQKIADFLSNIDKKISITEEKLDLFKDYKKGIMQKIFKQELRFKDSNGNDYPEWEEKILGNIIIKNKEKNKENKYNLVQSISNKYGFVNQDEYFEDRRVASQDLKNYYVAKNKLFAYNPSRINVGSLAYKEDNNISVISPLYVSFYSNKEYLIDKFLFNWLFSLPFVKQMSCSFEGSVRNNLSFETLSNFTINLPCLEEQQKIANFLSSIDNKIDNLTSELENLKEFKKGLLQQMFV